MPCSSDRTTRPPPFDPGDRSRLPDRLARTCRYLRTSCAMVGRSVAWHALIRVKHAPERPASGWVGGCAAHGGRVAGPIQQRLAFRSDPDPQERVAAVMATHGRALLGVANRWSLCHDDALDAYQRALEIYLRRIDSVDPATEGAWLRVVVKHEALAIRRARSG